MKTVGSLILLVMFALIVLVGITTTGDMIDEAINSNDTAITDSASGATGITSPIFQVMGFGVLIIGIMIAINAYR